jgi:hypothetical protein
MAQAAVRSIDPQTDGSTAAKEILLCSAITEGTAPNGRRIGASVYDLQAGLDLGNIAPQETLEIALQAELEILGFAIFLDFRCLRLIRPHSDMSLDRSDLPGDRPTELAISTEPRPCWSRSRIYAF